VPLNHHLRENWTKAGLSDKAGSAAVCLPAAAGFSRVYYLTSSEYAISNIAFSRLKVSRLSELNDPFELFAPQKSQRIASKEWREYRDKFDKENGVLCFSSDWTDPVLWSHYGARHQGICLGFNVKDTILHNVTYQTNRMKADVAVSGLTDLVMDKIFSTKFDSWSYEKERRVQVPLVNARQEGPLYFIPFDVEIKLMEVIVGPLCSLNVKRVRSVVQKLYKDVITFKARLASNSFYVVPDEPTVPVHS
jgi:hypothetical protein